MSPPWSSIVFGLGIYMLVLLFISGAAWMFVKFQTDQPIEGFYGRAWSWIGKWHLIVLGITLTGGIAGLFLFPVFGMLLGMDLGIGEMALNGILDGAFYACIWAPGISFITCLILANRRRRQDKALEPNTLDTKD